MNGILASAVTTCALVSAVAGAAPSTCGPRAAAIRRHVRVLGADAMEGRFPGSAGGLRAARYLADSLKQVGFQPAGDDGTYLQWVPLRITTPRPCCQLLYACCGKTIRPRLGEDYLLLTGGNESWLPQPTPMVFVGYGIVAPEYDYNDYSGIDVEGRVAVVLEGEPPSTDPAYFAGVQPTAYTAIAVKQRIAMSRGAAGVLVLTGFGDHAATRWAVLRREFAFSPVALAYAVPRSFGAVLSPQLSRTVLDDALYDWDSVRAGSRVGTLTAFELPGAVSFRGAFAVRHVRAPNVVGVLPGAGSRRGRGAIVVSAHYDHLGVGPQVAGDGIYNGVVDNALGVAGALEIARCLAMGKPPRRPVIVLFVTGEEEGLLGSSYFLDHPPMPVRTMAADINIDGLAFQDAFDDVVGVGAELSDLGAMLATAAQRVGVRVAPPPPEMATSESFARSDQKAFAEAGVPSILVAEGLSWRHAGRAAALRRQLVWLATVYHSPRDDLNQPLDFDAAADHAAVILELAREVAAAGAGPRWRPGTVYEYRRWLSRARGR